MRPILFTALIAAFSSLPLFAHHSFIAEYDAGRPVTLSGAVARIDWLNPHIWIYVDVMDARGVTTRWGCEGGAPNSLTRLGWSKDTLKPGDRVTLEGSAAKDMAHTCVARWAVLPDGRRLASSASDGVNRR